MNTASKIENLEEQSTAVQACLDAQKKAYIHNPSTLYFERRKHLLFLKQWVLTHKEEIISAINQDYGNRSRTETLLFEIYPVVNGIDFVLKRLKGWMSTKRRSIDWKNFFGASNSLVPQPLGVVGIIVPWNFPLFLSLSPLTYILAAGNSAMIKMSSNSSRLAELMVRTLPIFFNSEKLQVYQDVGGLGRIFSRLPFNHLLFTGSEATGKAVMAAASQNLCPVTLELGGKSPALICPDFDIKKAAERILYAKFVNSGQICVTVDHVYIEAGKIENFVQCAKLIVAKRYPKLNCLDYTSIINKNRFNNLVEMLQEAMQKGATLIQLTSGPAWDETSHKIAPHIVLNAPDDCDLMKKEIFGPILPVISYAKVQEVMRTIGDKDGTPLAFYPFTNDRSFARQLVQNIPSGGVSINDALYHVAQHDLPFGGLGTSGMGHYHSYEGFVTFSKMRPIFKQARFSLLPLMWPPYGRFAKWYLNFLIGK
jgi:coniferyl-aldehyde dehydrogenase